VDWLSGDWAGWGPFLAAWIVGWLLLARPRSLPAARPQRPAVSIVVPARDEAETLPRLLDRLRPELGVDDELVVVDDESADRTAQVAAGHGATVISGEPPPEGWHGKPHACWTGARATSREILVFLDADVMPRPGFLDRLVAAVPGGGLVSVQPWHEPGSWPEQLSVFGNVAALCGSGAFSALGPRRHARLAFGPVLALERATYERVGGHAHPGVRAAIVEDVALARRLERVELYAGRGTVSFRMYPGGGPTVWNGWTRTIAAGTAAAPIWATIATAGWIWSLAAAPFLGALAYAMAVFQVGVLARVAGRFSPLAVVCYPIPLLAFVVMTIRSVVVAAAGGSVDWRGRPVRSR
jgi:4,4'-diaponeurosporenoate glycosyltransferase